jgi:hypothetical protein
MRLSYSVGFEGENERSGMAIKHRRRKTVHEQKVASAFIGSLRKPDGEMKQA